MRRTRGVTLIELMVSLALIGTVSAVVFPTIATDARAARAVDARMEDADTASRARRRLAVDLRAASAARVDAKSLVLSIAGDDVVWSAGPHGLIRSAAGRAEDVARGVHEMSAKVTEGRVDVVIATATSRRSLTVALRVEAVR